MSAIPTSIFTARQRRYEQAIADFNDWFLSGQRGGVTYNRVIQDCELLAAIDAHKTAMLDTPALTLADVAAMQAEALGDPTDTKAVERMLLSQAATLQSLFAHFMTKATQAEMLPKFQAFADLALKSQNQCRRTLATLAEIRNPRRTQFIK